MVKETKVRMFNEIIDLLSNNNRTICVLNIEKVPGQFVKEFRLELDKEEIPTKFVKKRVLLKALDKLSEKERFKLLSFIKNYLGSETLIIATNKPFEEILRKIKSFERKRYIKPGEVAPEDIVLPKCEKQFQAGPQTGAILADLRVLGVKARPKGPVISIEEEKVVAKKGEVVSEKLASILQKFDIKPITVKLLPEVIISDNIVYPKDVLRLTEEELKENIKEAVKNCSRLNLYIKLPTKAISKIVIYREIHKAILLMYAAKMPNKATIKLMFRKPLTLAKHLNEKYLNKE